jgi:hypothetical protein
VEQVSANYWIPPLDWSALAALPVQFVSKPTNGMPALAGPLILLLAAVTLAALWPWRWSMGERQQVAILGGHALAVVGSSALLGRSVFVPRYLVYVLPLAIVPPAYWLCRIPDRLIRRVILGWGLVTLVFVLGHEMLGYLEECRKHPDISHVADTVLRRSRPDEPVIATDHGTYLLLRYYLGRRRPGQPLLLYDPAFERSERMHVVFASAIRRDDLWSSRLLARARGQRVWILSAGVVEWLPRDWEIAWEKTYYLPTTLGIRPFLRAACYESGPSRQG